MDALPELVRIAYRPSRPANNNEHWTAATKFALDGGFSARLQEARQTLGMSVEFYCRTRMELPRGTWTKAKFKNLAR